MKRALATILFIVLAILAQTVFGAEDVPRMTKEELKARLGGRDTVIIDVRSAHDWQDSTMKITGAIREDPQKPGTWIEKYPKEKTIVLYCK